MIYPLVYLSHYITLDVPYSTLSAPIPYCAASYTHTTPTYQSSSFSTTAYNSPVPTASLLALCPKVRSACSHHCRVTCTPGCRYAARHISSIKEVAIYSAKVLGHTSPPPTDPLPSFNIPEVVKPTFLLCPASTTFPPADIPPYGGNFQGYSQPWR